MNEVTRLEPNKQKLTSQDGLPTKKSVKKTRQSYCEDQRRHTVKSVEDNQTVTSKHNRYEMGKTITRRTQGNTRKQEHRTNRYILQIIIHRPDESVTNYITLQISLVV